MPKSKYLNLCWSSNQEADEIFKNTLNINEKVDWDTFEKVVKGFSGKKKAENYT